MHEVQRASDPKVQSEAKSYDAIGDLQEGLVKAGSGGGGGSGEGGEGGGRGGGKGASRLHDSKGTGGGEDRGRGGARGGRRVVKTEGYGWGMDGKGGVGGLSPTHASGGQRQRDGKVDREKERGGAGGSIRT
jgi:hypothetical protein